MSPATSMDEHDPSTPADRPTEPFPPAVYPVVTALRGVRIVPVAGGLAGAAPVDAVANALRRQRARGITTTLVRIAGDARRAPLAAPALFAAAGPVRRRSVQRSRPGTR